MSKDITNDLLNLLANEIYSVLKGYWAKNASPGTSYSEKDNDLIIFVITKCDNNLSDIFDIVQKTLHFKSNVNVIINKNVLCELEKYELSNVLTNDDIAKHVLSHRNQLRELSDRVTDNKGIESCSVFWPSVSAKYISRIVNMTEDDEIMEVVTNAVKYNADFCLSVDNSIKHVRNKYYIDIFHSHMVKLKQIGINVLDHENLRNRMLDILLRREYGTDVKKSYNFLTYDNVVDAHQTHRHQLYVSKQCIITPLALDALREYGIDIIKEG